MKKILLVEDDSSLREIYGVRLSAEGYEVISAGDGEEALATTVREKPDLILSDVMMPKISGFDMLDILRATPETRDIKIIIMTALSAEDQRERGERLGADKFLVKSQVGIEDVVNAVKEVLGEKKPEESAVIPEMTMPAGVGVTTAPSGANDVTVHEMAGATTLATGVMPAGTGATAAEATNVVAPEAVNTMNTETAPEMTGVAEHGATDVVVNEPQMTQNERVEGQIGEMPVKIEQTAPIVEAPQTTEQKQNSLTVNGDEIAEQEENSVDEATEKPEEDKGGKNVFAYNDEVSEEIVPETKNLANTPEEEARLRAILDNAIAELSEEKEQGFISSGEPKKSTEEKNGQGTNPTE